MLSESVQVGPLDPAKWVHVKPVVASATGDTPLVYLQRVRVEEAKRMMETQNLSFDEIAYSVGYEDASAFRKIFLKQTGLRPTEYKRRFQRV